MINVLTTLEGGIHRLFGKDFSFLGLIAMEKLMRNINFVGNELNSGGVPRTVTLHPWEGTIPAVLG